MTRTCPFENSRHKQLSINPCEARQRVQVLRHCTALSTCGLESCQNK